MKKLVLVLVVFLAACSHKYKTDHFQAPPNPISLSGTAYIMVPKDGVYGRKVYQGSGRTVAEELSNAVSQHLHRATVATDVETLEQALNKARAQGVSYVFEPVIRHWEDRATEWSGIPDKITIQITVWETVSGDKIASTTKRASSKWGTFGGDHPQDLVPHVVNEFANQIMP